MSKVKICVGGGGDARADGAHQLAFENWQLLARVLTGKRVELLRHVRRHQAASVRRLQTRWAATTATSTPTSRP